VICGRRRRGAALALLFLLLYLALAFLVFAAAWGSPAERWIGDPKDPRLFIWYLGFVPDQLARGQLPLLTDLVAYPGGTNLLWNTSILVPAALLSPATAAWGPVVTYNLLVTMAVAASAWATFLAARPFLTSPWLQALAGLLFGFSPGLMAQSTRHVHVVIAILPPLALLLGTRLLLPDPPPGQVTGSNGSSPGGRSHPLRRAALLGALAGIAATVQLLTGEEMLALTVLVAGFGVLLLAWRRPALIRRRSRELTVAVGTAVATFALLAAYPLTFQFLGPERVFGRLQPPDIYVNDLVGFLVPNATLVQGSLSRAIVAHLTGNPSEDNAYVGLPLLVLAGIGLAGRRPAAARWLAGLTAIVAVLSLGPHLHLGGWTTPLPLPWLLFDHLPLLGSADPSRLMLIGYLGISLLVALGVEAAWQSSGRARLAVAAALGLGLLSVAPMIPFPTTAAAAPAFFHPGGDVDRLPTGSVVLITPFSSRKSSEAMFWQAVARYRFRMPEGDVFTPGPQLGPPPTFIQVELEALDGGQAVPVTVSVRLRVLDDLRRLRVGTVVAGPSPGRAAIVEFLAAILGRSPQSSGGVEVWWDCCPLSPS